MPSNQLEKLILDVFDPQPGEIVLIITDVPHGDFEDYDLWQSRRKMAEEWQSTFEQLGNKMGFQVSPLLTYPATGNHNAQLPGEGEMAGEQVRFDEVLQQSNIIVAMTEFSATAPLMEYSKQLPEFRAASMPMVHQGMMETALAADYQKVAEKCRILFEKLDRAKGANLLFSTSDQLYIDLRNRQAEIDDGKLPKDKQGARVINLPSGEVYIAPYEGELSAQPSFTEGTVPLIFGDALLTLEVQGNQFTRITGDEQSAIDELQEWFDTDDARRNLAELGLGCNEHAVITGNVLEDEKVLGVHLAAGRSDHLGGVVGVDDFIDPGFVIHQDIVFPFNGELFVESLSLIYEDGTMEEIIKNGAYTIFSE
jgi:hypothetical protein